MNPTATTNALHEAGLHWGRGAFTLPEATALRARLARSNAATIIATLRLLSERGDAETRESAMAADAATRALSPAARESLLTHPTTCYGMTRLADLVADAERLGMPVMAATPIENHCMRALRGAALAGGASVCWRSQGRCVLPGVGLVIDAPAGTRVRIDVEGNRLVGCFDDERQFEAELTSSAGPVLMARGPAPWVLPSFSIGGMRLHIDVHDPAFVEGWIPKADFSSIGVDMARAEDLETWRVALEDASRLMERVLPATAGMLGWIVRSFVPVVSHDGSIACSMSDAMLPGAIMSSIDGAPVLAESLAHEFRHNLLHQLELAYPIFEPGSPGEARFYSPWRTDPRPLYGILHALFVFIDVCAIHAGVRGQRLGDAHDQHDSAVRLASNMRRIRIALEEFRRHAHLTAFGRGFVQGIEHACDAFEPALAALPAEAVRQAEQEVAQHRTRWRPA